MRPRCTAPIRASAFAGCLDRLVDIDCDLEGDGHFVPAHGHHRGIGLELVEVVGQGVMKLGRLGLTVTRKASSAWL